MKPCGVLDPRRTDAGNFWHEDTERSEFDERDQDKKDEARVRAKVMDYVARNHVAQRTSHNFQKETTSPPATMRAPPTSIGAFGTVWNLRKVTICQTTKSVAI